MKEARDLKLNWQCRRFGSMAESPIDQTEARDQLLLLQWSSNQMCGLIINLIIIECGAGDPRYKLFGWWMIVSFLWASAIAWQLPPPYQLMTRRS